MGSSRTIAEREAITRAVLESPSSQSYGEIGRRVGLHRDAVRQILFGLINADILPELPRLDRATANRRCTGCTHYSLNPERRHVAGETLGTCGMEFPESVQVTYARECAAYWPAPASRGQP